MTRTLSVLAGIAALASAACSPREPPPPAPPATVTQVPEPAPEVRDAGGDAEIPAPAEPPDAGAPPEGMALVPAGPFTMGADTGGELDEHPAHTVDLPAFWLDLTEVPNEAWDRCVAAARLPAARHQQRRAGTASAPTRASAARASR